MPPAEGGDGHHTGTTCHLGRRTTDRSPHEDAIRAVLERAVVAGVIDRAQADAITQTEFLGVSPGARGASRVRLLVAEALGYVGAALALVSAVLVV